MKDVAREAGVSVGTVSNYINGKKVRSDVAVKIETAIQKLDYVRNNAARFLKTNRSAFIILVIPTVWSPYFSELTFWIQKELDELGYKMILCISENNYQKEKAYVQMAEEQRVAGIISVSYSNLTSHIHSNIPLVSIEKESTGMFSLISSNNYAGGRLAAYNFKKRHINDFYFIGSNNLESVSMIARKSGFIDYCNEYGLKVHAFSTSSSRNNKHLNNEISVIIDQILNNSKLGDIGIFAHTDELALLLISNLHRKNINIPDDVQVIGFDGWRLTREDSLGISSIRQPVLAIARHAVKQLDKEIQFDGQLDPVRINLPVSFRAGNTTSN